MRKSFVVTIAVIAVIMLGGPLVIGSHWPRIQAAYWNTREKLGLVRERELSPELQAIKDRSPYMKRKMEQQAAKAKPAHPNGTRACAERDLVGAWDMVELYVNNAPPPSHMSEHFIYYDNGFMRHIASTKPVDPNAVEYKAMMTLPATVMYKVYANGILQVQFPDLPGPTYSLCSVVTADNRVSQKGDVLLAFTDDNKDNMRVLRKAR